MNFLRIFFFAGCLCLGLFALAPSYGSEDQPSWSFSGDAQLTGGFRGLYQERVAEYDKYGDLYFRGGIQSQIRWSAFELKWKPELRNVLSKGVSKSPLDPSSVSARGPERFMKLQQKWFQSQDHETFFDTERLDLTYRNENLEIFAGRRPVSLGVLRVIPVWNKFSIALPTQGGPRWTFSPDGAALRNQLGDFSFRLMDLEGDKSTDSVRIGEAAWFQNGADLYLLGGSWWQESTLGIAGSFDVLEATLRLELLEIGLQSGSKETQGQYGLGVERALSDQWTFLSEFVYFSKGVTDRKSYSLSTPSRFMSFRASAYGLFQMDWQVISLMKISFGSLFNFVDGSPLLLFKTNYSLTDEMDLVGDLSIPAGREGSEFSVSTFKFSNGTSLGFPIQGSLGLKAFF